MTNVTYKYYCTLNKRNLKRNRRIKAEDIQKGLKSLKIGQVVTQAEYKVESVSV